MDEQLESELFEALELLENWDLLEQEADWELFLAIDNTPAKERVKKRKPKPKAAGDEKA